VTKLIAHKVCDDAPPRWRTPGRKALLRAGAMDRCRDRRAPISHEPRVRSAEH